MVLCRQELVVDVVLDRSKCDTVCSYERDGKMITIKKYELKEGENRVSAPSSSNVLAAGEVEGKIWVWMEVETDDIEMVNRAFLVVKDGQEIDGQMSTNFIGLAVMPNADAWVVLEIL